MAMKCPSCGAENAEGERFCGDCGVAMSQLQAIQHHRASVGLTPGLRAVLIVAATVAVAIMIVLAIVLMSGLGETEPPEEVFAEWIDCMNNRDPMGAADLTISSKMNTSDYIGQAETLAGYLADMSTYNISLNYATKLSKAESSGESWYPYIEIIVFVLETDYGIEIDDWSGFSCSILVYQNGDWDVWTDTWPCFMVGSSWYLGYPVESIASSAQ